MTSSHIKVLCYASSKHVLSLSYVTVQYSTVQYSTVQYSTVQYGTVPHARNVVDHILKSLL